MGDKATILAFIAEFSGATDTFLRGCCYWFAQILSVRFGGETVYEPIEGHFLQRIDGALYDVRGDMTEAYKAIPLIHWDGYEDVDPLHYQHIFRDCVLKARCIDDGIDT